jgi:hypothetical protein
MKDARFVTAHFEHGRGRSAVQEMDPADPAGPFDEKTPNPVSRQAVKVVIPPGQGKAGHLNEPLTTSRQMPAETQETLAMSAKGVQAGSYRPAVRPESLVALILDVFPIPIPGRIPPEKNSQSA